MKAVGNMRLEISGMDRLIELTQQQLKDKSLGDARRKALQESLVLVTIFQTIGQNAEGKDGKKTRVYDFVLAKDGKLTLNGTDLSAIQAMIGAAREAQK